MMQKTLFKGNFTSHSLRATSATRLYAQGIEEQKICEITGHRSTCVRAYKRTSDEQRKQISNVLQSINSIETGSKNIKIQNEPCIPQLNLSKESSTNFTIVASNDKKMTIEALGNENRVLISFN